ncbi:MAG: hypothetical protein BGP04_00425 [Rhizobiales bacterium 62-17]|nr:hypothetical protein [Hyphomicrobiales bacterium]OJY03941.1 MAG: hypothetical protein BGP04_00425 [Rhizobiales bacterium 62-17]
MSDNHPSQSADLISANIIVNLPVDAPVHEISDFALYKEEVVNEFRHVYYMSSIGDEDELPVQDGLDLLAEAIERARDDLTKILKLAGSTVTLDVAIFPNPGFATISYALPPALARQLVELGIIFSVMTIIPTEMSE